MTARIRVKFTKTGRIRFLSHLDFMTLMHRAVVRAGVPVAYTQGFNPHPKIAFGPALSVGMESEAEYLDMETDPFVDLLQVTKDLNSSLPEGVRVLEARIIPKQAPSLSGSIGRYLYEVGIPEGSLDDIKARIQAFLDRQSIIVERGEKAQDIRPGIESVGLKSSTVLEVTLQDTESVRPRVADVIEQLFGVGSERSCLFRVKRTAMCVKKNGAWIGPMDAK